MCPGRHYSDDWPSHSQRSTSLCGGYRDGGIPPPFIYIYTHFTSVYYRDIPSYLLLFCLIYTYFFNICIHHGRYDVTAEIVTFNLSFSQTLFLPSFLLTLNIHQRWYHLNLRNFTISNVSAQQVGHTIYILISFPPNIDHNHTYYVLATLDSET